MHEPTMGRLSILLLLTALGCSDGAPPATAQRPAAIPATTPAAATAVPSVRQPERLRVKVLSTRPHDPGAYTQGLLWHNGMLYESTGLEGLSSLRQVDPQTGEVKRRVDIPLPYFAEGLALAGDRLFQLTWQQGEAFVYRLSDFQKIATHGYPGEGWGLCHDGKRLIMSDGSARLTFRDPETFAPAGDVWVTAAGIPVDQLNELECVDGAVYANVYQTEDIVRIDPATGEVTAVIDASGLLAAADYQAGAEVLNGIAWMPETKRFLITGKNWPLMFEVELVPKQ
jgi:glutaminyl-peptide cyclotransferase